MDGGWIGTGSTIHPRGETDISTKENNNTDTRLHEYTSVINICIDHRERNDSNLYRIK